MTADWDRARTVADAVLYEGYLLYPYRATSSRNRSRWQWGVLGPAGAADAGIGEDGLGFGRIPGPIIHADTDTAHRSGQQLRGAAALDSMA